MTKATCSKCGFIVHLDIDSPSGDDRWEISEAVRYLVARQREHVCK